MGKVTVTGNDGNPQEITVDDNTEAIVLANQEVKKAIGALRATMVGLH